jgi:WD40 repeat protein
MLKRTLKGHSRLVESVVFSRDGKTLASGSDELTVRLWNLSR